MQWVGVVNKRHFHSGLGTKANSCWTMVHLLFAPETSNFLCTVIPNNFCRLDNWSGAVIRLGFRVRLCSTKTQDVCHSYGRENLTQTGAVGMKVTDELTNLVVELGELESFERAGSVISHDGVSVKALLSLFNETDNPRSKQVVREIFDEAGYGWFFELDEGCFESAAGLKAITTEKASGIDDHVVIKEISDNDPLSEEEFLDLMPASAYFH